MLLNAQIMQNYLVRYFANSNNKMTTIFGTIAL